MNRQRVMLVDPSGDAYGKGLATGLSSKVDLFYITTKNNIEKCDIDAKVFLLFYSGTVDSKIKKVIKGIKYITTYLKILKIIKLNHIDVVHIEWLLVPKLDRLLLKILKKFGVRVIYTAHNVLPHRNGEQFVSIYDEIYNNVDKIIVHGEEIKKEFSLIFPKYSGKLAIEKHGVYMGQSVRADLQAVSKEVIYKSQNAEKTIIFFGNIFYNKGLDRLLKLWLDNYFNDKRYYLIVVGKKDPGYVELSEYEQKMKECTNVFYKPVALDEEELNTYISLSNLIVMPYRHASMSGIIFKAAEMKKAVFTTAVGSIAEYIDDSCGYIVENKDEIFEEKLTSVIESVEKDILVKMGQSLYEHIHHDYDWNEIAQKTIQDAYVPL